MKLKWIRRILFFFIMLIVISVLTLLIGDMILTQRMKSRLGDSLHENTKSVLVEDYTMVYREFGDDSNPTMVFIHGFMGSSYDFRFLFDDLSQDYHLIFVDLIGFGLSDKPRDFDYSRSNQARFVSKFLTELKIDAFHLVGHSMGGEIALNIALLDSSRIESLMLFASTGSTPNKTRTLPLLFYRLFFSNYLMQRLAFQTVHAQPSAKSKEGFENFYYFTHKIPAKTAQAFSRNNDSGNIASDLESIAIKTLLIWGKEDRWVPLSQGEQLDASLPNSELVIIDNSGHLAFIEEPQQIVDLLLNFLNE